LLHADGHRRPGDLNFHNAQRESISLAAGQCAMRSWDLMPFTKRSPHSASSANQPLVKIQSVQVVNSGSAPTISSERDLHLQLCVSSAHHEKST